ncbi:MAG: hypothetical protein IID07_08200 [Gemmatimonadetes bacterium]|nr:hypothetical protein [Gemmatimonadota bacterium]
MKRRRLPRPSRRRPGGRLGTWAGGPWVAGPWAVRPWAVGPWVAGFGLALLAAGWSAPAAAQVEDPPAAEVDSARIRVLERLNSLSRPPGVDSTLFVVDTIGQPRRVVPTPQPQAADSFMAALLALPGYSVSRYSGGGGRFDAETQRITLIGSEDRPARVSQDGRTVTAADTINLTDSLLWTAGETLTERPGEDDVRSTSIIYDRRANRGTAFDAHTTMSQGATWIMDGDLPAILPDTVFGHNINFTSCEETVPHYHFAAREFKAIGGSWFVARNVTLNFDDVPVFWLPFILQSSESGRHSGILTPRFAINDIVRTSRGQSRRVSNIGFFWAINDYADATFAGDWWSDNFTALTGAFRYRVTQRFLNGSANVRRFWEVDGGRQLSFDTRHNWTVDERMDVRVSARYASSSSFVTRNSFDPREVTQSINSEGGVNRRFDWGNLSVSADRRQFLSDDRVEMTLPSANLSLKTITLFQAPASRARFYNNLTWSGSARYRRNTVDRAPQPPLLFTRAQADKVRSTASISSGLNLAGLSWSQSLSFTETADLGVPATIAFPGDTLGPLPTGVVDLATADITWSMSLNYQQRLIGTTTFTPNLQVSGAALRSDEIPEASNFVAGPRRISFGARLKSDIYGYYGGFAGFEAVRHKLSPSISYAYAPKTVATDLQEIVFGPANSFARNLVTVGLNQTFEAKRREVEGDESGGLEEIGIDLEEDLFAPDSILDARADSLFNLQDAPIELLTDERRDGGGPRRLPASRVINLMTLNTSVVTYDFVRAKKADDRLAGFTTTRLRNQISSDFARGLQLSMEHDLFGTEIQDGESRRVFDPLLTQLNLSFAVSSSSGIVQTIARLLGGGGDAASQAAADSTAALEDSDELDPRLDNLGNLSPTDESSIIPGAGSDDVVPRRAERRRSTGAWNTNFSYSLRRERDSRLPARQLLQMGLRLKPTENWDLVWRTSYDITERKFADHSLRLTRDLHRWRANFDYTQTVTGNWSFRFSVSLRDNSDLKFDYDQQSTDLANAF